MRVEQQLDALVREAIRSTLGEDAPALLRPANAEHGDYQVNGILPLAKQLKKPPRSLAEPLAEKLRQLEPIASAEVAGPGFVNLRLAPHWVAQALQEITADREHDGVPAAAKLERIVVDFSGPNIAKQMHVGHLRSTIIGEAVCRLLRFIGHTVIGDNHLGDWGTQFGMLIMGMREFGSPAALDAAPVDELERVYKLASARSKTDPAFADAARSELAKLQRGDASNKAQWQRFVDATRVELDKVYDRFAVKFDLWMGESAYEDALPGVIQLLEERGLAVEDQGALCVFFEGNPELNKSPMIVRKKDGAYLYATTDVATLLYRRDQLHADRAIYVVDARQALHFKQLFELAKRLGIHMQLQHVSFGSVLGKDGKPLKTRDGEVIRLSALLDEAEERASERMRSAREEHVIDLDDSEIAALAPVVGIGAVKYADLMQNRTSDYQFDWDKLISFKGNAGPYLQYAHARIQAVFRKGEVDPEVLTRVASPLLLEHPAELALGKELLRFGDVVHAAAEQCLPHLLCEHLYAVARAFSVFYEACPMLRAEPAQRDTRLTLAWLAARQLQRGLDLLGIAAPVRM